MDIVINGVPIHYVEHGAGVPLLALHGSGVDHRELEIAVESAGPGDRYRRVYLDLPGMGRSGANGLHSNDDVVRLLGNVLDHLGGGPALVLGHSYGAYLARGLCALRPESVRGLALLCPLADRAGDVPDQAAVITEASAYDELDADLRPGFDEYFVVRTPATARRYRDHVVPGISSADEHALEEIFGNWSVDLGAATMTAPSLIAAGRRDSVVGYRDALALLDVYPHATLAVVEDAGHALMHERPELFGALLRDWLDRCMR